MWKAFYNLFTDRHIDRCLIRELCGAVVFAVLLFLSAIASPHSVRAEISIPPKDIHTFIFHNGDAVHHTVTLGDPGETLNQPEDPEAPEGKRFIGWFEDAAAETPFTRFGQPAELNNETTYIYAGFADAVYITYYDPDDAVLLTVTLAVGSDYSFDPAYPVFEAPVGMANGGWKDTAGDLHNGNEVVSESLDLKPDLTPGYYARFFTQGGSPVISQFLAPGASVVTPEDPTRSCYAFSGWYDKPEGGALFDFSSVPEADVDLYARWTPSNCPYTLIFMMQNADDDGYTYHSSYQKEGIAGTPVRLDNDDLEYAKMKITGIDRCFYKGTDPDPLPNIMDDGSSRVTVYSDRIYYSFRYNNKTVENIRWGQDLRPVMAALGLSDKTMENCYSLSSNELGTVFNYNPEDTVDPDSGYSDPRGSYWMYSSQSLVTLGRTYDKIDKNSQYPIGFTFTLAPQNWRGPYIYHVYNYYQTTDSTDEDPIYEYLYWRRPFNASPWRFAYPAATSTFYLDRYEGLKRDGNFLEAIVSDGSIPTERYFKRVKYDIIFFTNGGPDLPKITQVPFGKEISSYEPESYQAGKTIAGMHGIDYVFQGWYKDSTLIDSLVWETAKMPDANLSLYAAWAPLTSTVTFDPNGGTLTSDETVSVPTGTQVPQPTDPVHPSGLTFLGWTLENGHPYDFASPVAEDITLTAQWMSDALYRVSYDPGEGSGEVTDGNEYHMHSAAVAAGDAGLVPPEGQHFLYWQGPDEVRYYPGEIVPIGESDVTLTAIYGPAEPPASLIYDLNYSTFGIPVPAGVSQRDEESAKDLPNYSTLTLREVRLEEIPAKWHFGGWYLNPGCTDPAESITAEVMIDAADPHPNVVYAKWLKHPEAEPMVRKRIEGTKPDPAKSYTFTLTPAAADQPLPEKTEITVTGEGTASFGEILFPSDGTYTYVIRETPGSDPFCTYDGTVYSVTWTVEGENIEVSYEKNGEPLQQSTAAFTFTNVYPESYPDGEAAVKKKVIDGEPGEDEVFSFVMRPLENSAGLAENPMPEGSENGEKVISIKGSQIAQSAGFGVIGFPLPGDYVYEITEIPGTDGRYTYDPAVYRVTFSVTEDMAVKLSALKDGTPVEGTVFLFENRLLPLDAEAEPEVSKIISGGTPKTKVTFDFILTAVSNTAGPDVNPMPEGSKDGKKVISITGEGKGSFGKIRFVKAGDYVYEIVEDMSEEHREYEYDPAVYSVTYRVTRDGQVEVSALMDGIPMEDPVFLFENQMTSREAEAEPEVSKVITGGEPEAGEKFYFTLTAVGNTAGLAANPMPSGSRNGSKTISVRGTGTASFGKILFTAEGDYVYEVEEDTSSENGYYDYDPAVYTLIYSFDGYELRTKIKKDGRPYEESLLIFENEYAEFPASVNPRVKKAVDGKPKEKEQFVFELRALTNTAGLKINPMPRGAKNGVMTIRIRGAGERGFGTIRFEEPGRYIYQAAEIPGKTDGWTYDRALYTLTYDVSLSKDETVMKVETLITRDGDAYSEKALLFKNKFRRGGGEDPGPGEQIGGVLPRTGFAPGRMSVLPKVRPAYAAYSELRIRIPSLGVDAEILGVPKQDGDWDVSWLGDKAGWLQDSAWPGSTKAGNTVITGHSYDHYGLPGVFSGLERLSYGCSVTVEAFGEKFIYLVEDVQTVYADTPQVLSQDVDHPRLTLITCRFYNPAADAYDGRVVVRARLAEIQ